MSRVSDKRARRGTDSVVLGGRRAAGGAARGPTDKNNITPAAPKPRPVLLSNCISY